jgi:hypothetical protein
MAAYGYGDPRKRSGLKRSTSRPSCGDRLVPRPLEKRPLGRSATTSDS